MESTCGLIFCVHASWYNGEFELVLCQGFQYFSSVPGTSLFTSGPFY